MTTLELDPQLIAIPGMALGITRENLAEVLQNPRMTSQGYEERMVDYLNAFQELHFGAENKFSTYRELACMVSAEVCLITGETADMSVLDVEKRIKEFESDETGQYLRAKGFARMPRAVTLTLLDLLDSHRPLDTCRQRA